MTTIIGIIIIITTVIITTITEAATIEAAAVVVAVVAITAVVVAVVTMAAAGDIGNISEAENHEKGPADLFRAEQTHFVHLPEGRRSKMGRERPYERLHLLELGRKNDRSWEPGVGDGAV